VAEPDDVLAPPTPSSVTRSSTGTGDRAARPSSAAGVLAVFGVSVQIPPSPRRRRARRDPARRAACDEGERRPPPPGRQPAWPSARQDRTCALYSHSHRRRAGRRSTRPQDHGPWFPRHGRARADRDREL